MAEEKKGIDIKEFSDEYHEIHRVTDELGRGGQGVVNRTSDPDIAIKLVVDQKGEPIFDKEKSKLYTDKFRKLHFLPIPKDIPISLPLSVLRDCAGYVMTLANDMKPLNNLLSGISKTEKIPERLKEMDEKDQKAFLFYAETGSTKVRMIILYKVAVQLARLHGRSLIYGDISPNNIFYSAYNNSIFFIDADNICLETDQTGIVYTPRYGASELVERKNGITPQSDVWAFAVFAYELLTMNYPFTNNSDNSGDDWENTSSTQNQETYDYSQLADNGIPTALIFHEKLQKLFQQTLLEGENNRFLRPQMFEFAKELAKTADTLIDCSGCKMSYFYDYIEQDNGKHQCPYCGTKRPEIIIVESYYYNSKKGKLSWKYAINIQNKIAIIPKRVFTEFLMQNSDNEVLQFSFENNYIILKNLQDTISLHIATKNKPNFEKIFTQIKINKIIDKEFYLFAESANPRIINIQIIGEEK